MSYVEPINPLELIPKKKLIPLLEKEASDFLADIMNLELPPSNDRLNVPVIETDDKVMLQRLNETTGSLRGANPYDVWPEPRNCRGQ